MLKHVEQILVQWEAVARTMIPPAETMSVEALRDHARSILVAIATDMETAQSEQQRSDKSKGLAPLFLGPETSAAAHGALRQRVGFNLSQLAGEYRAFRATVLRLWQEEGGDGDRTAPEQMTRFNEGVDQALAESITSYSANVASSRDMFLAVLGHDLRNPLGSLSGCLSLLGNPKISEEKREKALRIGNRSVQTIEEMITDLLEYTRTRLGRGMEVDPKMGDIGALCQRCVDQMSTAHPAREIDSAIEADLRIEFDAARMHQVVINLLANAVQHGDPRTPIRLSARGTSNQITIEVTNWGKPIPPDMAQVIFDPLVQIPSMASEPHERPATSLGLGLFIAREIVVAHGGAIRVTSSELDGTVFTVNLPYADRSTLLGT